MLSSSQFPPYFNWGCDAVIAVSKMVIVLLFVVVRWNHIERRKTNGLNKSNKNSEWIFQSIDIFISCNLSHQKVINQRTHIHLSSPIVVALSFTCSLFCLHIELSNGNVHVILWNVIAFMDRLKFFVLSNKLRNYVI